jgi:hypothetical protein
LVSKGSLRDVGGVPLGSEMYVSASQSLSTVKRLFQEFLFYYERYTPPPDASQSRYSALPSGYVN